MITMHIRAPGEELPLCRFIQDPLGGWPLGHIPINAEEYEETAAACRDPEHELHSFAPYKICGVCEQLYLASIGRPHPEPSAESLAEMPELTEEWFRKARRGGPRLHVKEMSFAELGDRLRTFAGADDRLRKKLQAIAAADAPARERQAKIEAELAELQDDIDIEASLLDADLRVALSAIATLEKMIADAERSGTARELRRKLLASEVDGSLPTFYSLCFNAVLSAARPDDAAKYLDMAEHVAHSRLERAILDTARASLQGAES